MLTKRKGTFSWDEAWYVERYPDIAQAISERRLSNPLFHFLKFGIQEGRFPSKSAEEQYQLSPETTVEIPTVAIGDRLVPLNYPVKAEAAKTFGLRLVNGFFEKYLSGSVVLDVGYKGGHADAVPILPGAIGVDLDFPNYDGKRLPFQDASVDCVFTSHVLEHLADPTASVRDWFRVLRVGGYIVCIVPHQFLYEKKREMPSNWSGEHLRFYTPASLLYEYEKALQPNSYRVRHLVDNDLNYRYDLNPSHHAGGCYEIELVIEKILLPNWTLA